MKYTVSTSTGQHLTIEAADVVVSEHGTLTFYNDHGGIVAAFPPDGWVRLRRYDQ